MQNTKNSTPERTESAVIEAGHKLVHFIIEDDGMAKMNREEINRVLNYAIMALNDIFSMVTPPTLQEIIATADRFDAAMSGHQAE